MSAIKKLGRTMRLAGLTLGVMALLPRGAAAAGKVGSMEGEMMLITTEGQSEVRVRPDSTRVIVGVEAEAETLEKARSEVNAKMQSVIQALNRLRIPGLSLQTQVIQFYPIRGERKGDELPPIVGYHASNTLAATVIGAPVEDLGQRASRIVDASIRAGANMVHGISFFVNDVGPAQLKALQDAVHDAERSAQAMARAANVKLGRLHALEASPAMREGPVFRAFDAAAMAATPIETGETVISRRVTAKYTFRK